VVGCRGIANNGSLVVSELIHPGLADMPTSPVNKIVEYYTGVDSASLNVAVACGPYTGDNDIEYAALDGICAIVEKSPVNAIVLVGPFVDARHALMKSGRVLQTPDEIFRERVSARLERMLRELPDLKVSG
jgi:DNA polymerase alpha subunit B